MPKTFSESERAYIRKRLHDEGTKCLSQYGIRKTTVDELVKRVNIPKGTFYLFYRTKEELLFEIILEEHERMNISIETMLKDPKLRNAGVEEWTNLLFGFFKQAERLPLLKVLNSEEIELLVRKLPQEMIQGHISNDDDMVKILFEYMNVKKDISSKVVSDALHGIYFMTLHKSEMDTECYDETLHMLLKGIITQIID